MTQFPDERGAELRQLFFETAQELLQALNDDALNLEKHPGDLETVRSIRRTVHTLKGDAAACGFRELSELAHELEDALTLEYASSPVSLAEVAFTAADAFEAMLVSYRSSLAPPSAEPVRKMIRDLAQHVKVQAPGKRKKKAAAPQEARTEWTEPERLTIQNALSQGKHVYQITVHLDPLCAMPIAARQLLLNAFFGIGQVLAAPRRPVCLSPPSAYRSRWPAISLSSKSSPGVTFPRSPPTSRWKKCQAGTGKQKAPRALPRAKSQPGAHRLTPTPPRPRLPNQTLTTSRSPALPPRKTHCE